MIEAERRPSPFHAAPIRTGIVHGRTASGAATCRGDGVFAIPAVVLGRGPVGPHREWEVAMRSRIRLISFLVVSLAIIGCEWADTPSPAVAPSEAVLEPRLIGIWRNLRNDELEEEDETYSEFEEGVLFRLSAFDDRQMLLEIRGPRSECGLDCSMEPCREVTECEDPIREMFLEDLARVLVTEVDGAQWVSICQTWISQHIEPTEAGPIPEEYRSWVHGRLSFLPGDTLLVEMLDDDIDGAEEATAPEAVRALLTEENLSGSERYLFVPVPLAGDTASPVADP